MLGDFQQNIPFDLILDSIDSAVILFDAETLQVLVANKRAEGTYGLAAGGSVEQVLVGLGTAEVHLKRDVTVGGRRCEILIIRNASERTRASGAAGGIIDATGTAGDVAEEKRAVETVAKYQERLVETVAQDGSTFPAMVSSLPIIRGGKPVGLRGNGTDITEVKQFAVALLESEKKFRDLTERSVVGIFLIQDGLFRYVNPFFASMCECSMEELIDRKGPEDFILEEDWPMVRDWIQLAAAATDRGPINFKGKTCTGKMIDCEAYGSWTMYCGKPAAIGTVVDVTDRKRAEKQIRMLNTLALGLTHAGDLQEALEVCLQSGLHVSGMEAGAAYAGDSVTHDLKLACSRGPSKGFKPIVSSREADAESMRMIMQGKPLYGKYDQIGGLAKLLHTGLKACQMAILPVLYEGNLIACFCMISRSSKAPPRPTLSLLESIALPIKEGLVRVWVESAMRKANEKYWTLMDGAPDAILLADTDGRILEANRKAGEILGYEKGDFLGQDFFGLLRPVPLEKAKAVFRTIGNGGSMKPTDTWLRRKGGVRVPVSVTASIVDFGGRKLIQGVFRHIAERKAAEKALRQSEEKYRMLMDDAVDAIIHIDGDGKIIESNKKAGQLLGYTKDEFLGINYSVLNPGIKSGPIAGKGKPGSVSGSLEDTQVTRKDGTLVDIHLSWSRIRIRGKSFIQVIMRDVSRRKRAEEALRESEIKYRTVFENTGTAMVIFEKDMTISFINTEFERISGYRRAEIERVRKWSDLIRDRAQQQQISQLRCISSRDRSLSPDAGSDVRPASFRAVISDNTGTGKHVHVNIASLPDSGRGIASIIDISPLVEAEHVVQQSEERYRALVQQSSEGIFIVEPRTKKIVEANEPFICMLGYEPEDIQNLSLYDLIMESKSFTDAAVGKTMQKGQYFMGERNFRGKNGLVIDVDVATSAVSYGNSKFIMMSFRDITEKKRMEEALRQGQKMEAIGTLAGGIAHDFNNILQVIAGCAYQLSTKLNGKGSDHLLSLARQVLSSSERASQLTRSILTFSRKQPIDPKPIDINLTIRNIEKFLKRIIGEEIELVAEYTHDSLFAMADQVQVQQVLMNVATNARDAMPGGGVMRISASLEEIGDQFVKTRGYGVPGAYACISISDTGIGMDEETKRRIFEPFYTTKKPGKGTGLGMSVVYGIVKQHNGYVDVESQPGTGTTVKVYFSLTSISHSEAHAIGESETTAPGGGETILLVEDEKDVRAFLKGILEDAGYRIIEAENGEEAVERCKGHKNEVHLALLDVVMPKKDGKQAYDEMRKENRGIKAIFMSGYSEDTVHRKGLLGTGAVLLSKPVSPVLLLSKIREALRS